MSQVKIHFGITTYIETNSSGYITWQAKYIATCLDEIKQELRQENAAVKANAVSKLTYVSMLTLKPKIRQGSQNSVPFQAKISNLNGH